MLKSDFQTKRIIMAKTEKKKKKVLVLGGQTGLLGQEIAKTYAQEENKYEVLCLGRQDFDIFNTKLLGDYIEKNTPDIIYNTIAYTQVDLAEDNKEEAFKVNATFAENLGKLLVGSKTALVHYSTDFVFDGKSQLPYTEEDKTNPLSVYGASKLAGEEALLKLSLHQCLIIRTSWLFGPGRKNFISVMLAKAKECQEVSVVYDQVGSPSYTLGLAPNSLALVNAKAKGIYHLTNSGIASWSDFAQEAFQIAGLTTQVLPIPSSEYPQKAKRPAYSVLSHNKFTELTGINPRPWSQALRDYIYSQEF